MGTLKRVGILTEDFAAYHDLVRALERADVPFDSLVFDEAVPARIGVVVTTEAEADRVPFGTVVTLDTDGGRPEARRAAARAKRLLEGRDKYASLILGVDPGEKPGFAVVADGEVLYATEAHGPEAVADLVEQAVESYPSAAYTVRIGHGATTHRDRILNALTQVPVPVEMVDERRTTPDRSRMSGERNIQAAIAIALTSGDRVQKRIRPLAPSQGEIRDIQDRSRQASEGRVTISRALAHKVASGEMSMEVAIAVQQGRREAA